MIGVLQKNKPGKLYLIASRDLEQTNNVSVTRFVFDVVVYCRRVHGKSGPILENIINLSYCVFLLRMCTC